MPVRYEIDTNKRIVRTVFSGSVTHDTVADHAVRLSQDPAFHPEFPEIIVFEDGSEMRLTYMDFTWLLRMEPFFARR